MTRFPTFLMAVILSQAFLFAATAIAQDDGFRVYATPRAGKYTYEIGQYGQWETGIRCQQRGIFFAFG